MSSSSWSSREQLTPEFASLPGCDNTASPWPHATRRTTSSASQPNALDGRLTHLALDTSPGEVNRALRLLFTRATEHQDHHARAIGTFILSLWYPSQYHQDLNDLAFLPMDHNRAVRHLLNFIITCQVNIRQLVDYSQISPLLDAWGHRRYLSHE